MMKLIYAWATGLVFGIGIAISGMMNPAKVLNFFDIAGTWDLSLAFVMGGAVAVTFIGYRLVWRRATPLFEDRFQVPNSNVIDARLVGGSALFGIGWGLAGFCPGPALMNLATGHAEVWLFVAAMLAGMGLHALLERCRMAQAAM